MPHIEVISRALIRRGHLILACRNVKHGYYYLPGGHVEFGECAAAAVARELREEAGLELQVGPCVLVSEGAFETGSSKHHEINLVFHGQLQADDRVESREPEIAFEWLDVASAVDVDFRPASIRAWVAAGGASEQLSGWASDFPRPA